MDEEVKAALCGPADAPAEPVLKPGKPFGEHTREDRMRNLAKANARRAELRVERNAEKEQIRLAKIEASLKGVEQSLRPAPQTLMADKDWRDYQESLRNVTPKAVFVLQKLLDSEDERLQLSAAKEILDRRWGKPNQTIVKESKPTEVVYSSSVLDAMKN